MSHDGEEAGGEDGILEARRSKAEHLRARGENPFSNQIHATERCWVQKLRERFEPALVGPKSEQRYDAAKVTALRRHRRR
jgi:hypothetical protein